MSDTPQPPADEPTAGPPADGPPPQGPPVLAPTWKRGCGLTIMIIGIIVTAFSGICTAGMTIGDMTGGGGGGGGDLNLSGIQFVVGGPFILIGALLWWGGWALSKAKPSGSATPPGPAGGPPPNPPAT